MTTVKTDLDNSPAAKVPFAARGDIPRSDVQTALEYVMDNAGGGGGGGFGAAAGAGKGGGTGAADMVSTGIYRVAPSASNVYRLEYYSTSSSGGGVTASGGGTHIYSRVVIRRG